MPAPSFARDTEGPLVGHGDESGWPEQRPPHTDELAAAAPGRTVHPPRVDGHSSVVDPATLADLPVPGGDLSSTDTDAAVGHRGGQGLDRATALAAHTVGGRRAGQQSGVEPLRAGMRADLAIWDADPLLHGRPCCLGTVRGGRTVHGEGLPM